MLFVRNTKKIGAYFDGATLRVGELTMQRDGQPTLSKEQHFPFLPEAIPETLTTIRQQFGKSIRLVIGEEGVYSFSVRTNLEVTRTRDTLEHALVAQFPEMSEATLWDARVVDERNPQSVLLEVAELKQTWYERLNSAFTGSQIVFESILPESSALARLFPKSTGTVVFHEKQEHILFLLVVSGTVITSLLFRKPCALRDVEGFLKYCLEEKGHSIDQVVLSGEGMIGFPLPTLAPHQKVERVQLDPLLGASKAVLVGDERYLLDFVDSIPHPAWQRRLRRCFY